jgi:hypothetical protein
MTQSQTRGSIVGRLAELDVGERTISARRKDLHEWIDSIYLGAPLDDVEVTLLERLEGQEREVSARRRRLHAEIDDLRAQVGLPIWRRSHELVGAA